MRSTELVEARILWVICFSATLGAIPAGVVGNTYIPLSLVATCVYFLYVLLMGQGRLRVAKSRSHIFLIAYVFYCALTVALPYFAGVSDQVGRVFKGLLVLVGSAAVFEAMTVNPSHLKLQYAIKGLLAGVTLNAVYGIYQYIGSFHQLPWINPPTPMRIADPMLLHRAQGFTSEPSVLASLLIPGMFLTIGRGGRCWVLLALVMVAALILTFSSGAVFLGVGYVVYFMAKVFNILRSGKLGRRGVRQLAAVAVMLLILTMVLVFLGGSSFRQRLGNIFTGTNPFAAENYERSASIVHSLELALKYPLGVGYNMGPTMMEHSGYQPNIHSLFAGIILETGFPGLFIYVAFVISCAYPLLRTSTSQLGDMLAISVATSLLYSFATGVFSPFEMVLWGISALAGGSGIISCSGADSSEAKARRSANCPSVKPC